MINSTKYFDIIFIIIILILGFTFIKDDHNQYPLNPYSTIEKMTIPKTIDNSNNNDNSDNNLQTFEFIVHNNDSNSNSNIFLTYSLDGRINPIYTSSEKKTKWVLEPTGSREEYYIRSLPNNSQIYYIEASSTHGVYPTLFNGSRQQKWKMSGLKKSNKNLVTFESSALGNYLYNKPIDNNSEGFIILNDIPTTWYLQTINTNEEYFSNNIKESSKFIPTLWNGIYIYGKTDPESIKDNNFLQINVQNDGSGTVTDMVDNITWHVRNTGYNMLTSKVGEVGSDGSKITVIYSPEDRSIKVNLTDGQGNLKNPCSKFSPKNLSVKCYKYIQGDSTNEVGFLGDDALRAVGLTGEINQKKGQNLPNIKPVKLTCKTALNDNNIIPGVSWGTANQTIKNFWNENHCYLDPEVLTCDNAKKWWNYVPGYSNGKIPSGTVSPNSFWGQIKKWLGMHNDCKTPLSSKKIMMNKIIYTPFALQNQQNKQCLNAIENKNMIQALQCSNQDRYQKFLNIKTPTTKIVVLKNIQTNKCINNKGNTVACDINDVTQQFEIETTNNGVRFKSIKNPSNVLAIDTNNNLISQKYDPNNNSQIFSPNIEIDPQTQKIINNVSIIRNKENNKCLTGEKEGSGLSTMTCDTSNELQKFRNLDKSSNHVRLQNIGNNQCINNKGELIKCAYEENQLLNVEGNPRGGIKFISDDKNCLTTHDKSSVVSFNTCQKDNRSQLFYIQ